MLGGSRALGVLTLKVALGVALIVLPVVVIWMPSSSTHPPRVEVHDEAGLLQDDAVRASLEQVDFREDVHLVVLTLDVDYDADFDREVLDYARAEHPEWLLSSSSSQWDDDVIVLAASPSGRWVGCYVGEDVEVDADAQGDIRSAGEKAFRSGDWAGGFEDMARETASSIGSRFLSFKAIMVAAGVVLLGVVELSALVRISISGRSAFERACRHCARVIRDYEVMRSRAGLIPADDAHGAQVLARFRPCERDYVELPDASAISGDRVGRSGRCSRCVRGRRTWSAGRPSSIRSTVSSPMPRHCSRDPPDGSRPGPMSRGRSVRT